jgi:hypothetical protein
MNSNPDNLENRRSFRYPISGTESDGELRFGNKRFHVNLVDESAGGYCVFSEQLPNIEIGEAGLLFIKNSWFEVRVTHVQSLEAPLLKQDSGGEDFVKTCHEEFTTLFAQAASKGPSHSETETAVADPPIGYRIGLCRLSDTFDPDIKPAYYSWAGLFCHLKQINPNTMGIIFMGIVLAMVVAIIPLSSLEFISSKSEALPIAKDVGWINKFEKKGKTQTKKERSDSGSSSVLESIARSASRVLPDTSNTSRTVSGALKEPAKESAIAAEVGKKIAAIREKIRRMPGATPFLTPEVVERLQLTESQQKRIKELIDSAKEAIKRIGGLLPDGRVKENEPAVKIILDAARENVIDLLDDQQKQKWAELSDELGTK